VDAADVLARTRHAAALWAVGDVPDAELVRLACDLLLAGYDGDGLVALAAASLRHAAEEVPGLLEAAMADVGVEFHPRHSTAGAEAAVRLMAARAAAGALPPADLAAWAHGHFCHGELVLAERLLELDDRYGMLEYVDGSAADLDAEVLAECARIAGEAAGPLRSRC
jgi:hypothetical protein